MNLYDEIKKSETREQVIKAIKEWFTNLPTPENKTVFDDRVDMFSGAAKARNFRADLIVEAKKDRAIFEGLKKYVLNESEASRVVEPELVALVLSQPPAHKRGKPKGSGSKYTEQQSMYYARAVWCLYHAGAGRYVLSTNSPNPANAYALVAEAAGATFDQVRNAATPDQLERLTKIAHLYSAGVK